MNSHGSMNRIYRLVWSVARGTPVPAAETPRGRGKGRRGRSSIRAKAVAASSALSLLAMSCAYAGPTGGQIVSGKGSISQSGSVTDIRQSSQILSIDWLSFDVASHDVTVNGVSDVAIPVQ